jgi:hypothetical protein
MKNLLFILFVFAASTLWAQETQTRNVAAFSGVKVAENIDVYLKKGTKESVKVEVTGTALSHVITEVSGSYLKVHMAEGRYIGKITVKVYVTYVKVDKLSASSGRKLPISTSTHQVPEQLKLLLKPKPSRSAHLRPARLKFRGQQPVSMQMPAVAGRLMLTIFRQKLLKWRPAVEEV